MNAEAFATALKDKGLPENYGDGWICNSARDLLQIAIVFGGYDRDLLRRRVAFAGTPGRKINCRTIENILQELYEEDQ